MNVLSIILSFAFLSNMSEAFAPNMQSNSGAIRSGATKMEMGLFDGISKAFGNEEVSEASVLI